MKTIDHQVELAKLIDRQGEGFYRLEKLLTSKELKEPLKEVLNGLARLCDRLESEQKYKFTDEARGFIERSIKTFIKGGKND